MLGCFSVFEIPVLQRVLQIFAKQGFPFKKSQYFGQSLFYYISEDVFFLYLRGKLYEIINFFFMELYCHLFWSLEMATDLPSSEDFLKLILYWKVIYIKEQISWHRRSNVVCLFFRKQKLQGYFYCWMGSPGSYYTCCMFNLLLLLIFFATSSSCLTCIIFCGFFSSS